jgi:hypothetical protein
LLGILFSWVTSGAACHRCGYSDLLACRSAWVRRAATGVPTFLIAVITAFRLGGAGEGVHGSLGFEIRCKRRRRHSGSESIIPPHFDLPFGPRYTGVKGCFEQRTGVCRHDHRPYWSITTRMSSTRQQVTLGSSLTGCGNRPSLMPCHQVDRPIGSGRPGPRKSFRRTNPSHGSPYESRSGICIVVSNTPASATLRQGGTISGGKGP